MRELKIENSIQDLSVVDLFETIDNVDNNNEENDKIIETVKDKIEMLLTNFLKKKKEKKRKKEMLRRYKEYLKAFYNLIEKQMNTIDILIAKDTLDISDTFLNLKKELIDYSMKVYKLDLLDMEEVLNSKEINIYQYIHVYDFLDKYNSDIGEDNWDFRSNRGMTKTDNNKYKENFAFTNWKTYYYLVLNLEKQQEYNTKIISYLMAKTNRKDNRDFYLNFSNFYAADFQGQLSKSIYCQRKKLKLTQMRLSERSGIDRTMIAKIEKVKQPTTLETAIKLLTSLNLGIAIYPFTDTIEKTE